MDRFLNVPVDQIVESRWQPREDVGDPAAFAELVANVKMHGIKAPLRAFVNEDGIYELIAGHRRRQAAAVAGLTHVPLVVVGIVPRSEEDLRALREEVLFDNLLHEPLTPLEEARAFKALQEEEGYSIRRIAERLGKSKGYVQHRLELLQAPEDVQKLACTRAGTLRHAQTIAKVEDADKRAELIEQVRAGATTREIEAQVDQVVSLRRDARRPPSPPDEDKEPTLPEPPEEELYPEPAEEIAEERLIPVNGNGKTVYISIPGRSEGPTPEPGPDRETALRQDFGETSSSSVETLSQAAQDVEERVQQVTWKHANPAIGAPTAAGQHCPHCGDSQGREICNVCGRNRWIIAFSNIEDYQRALALIGVLVRR